MDDANLDAALKLAAQGIPVFPCHAVTKRPLTEHGFKDASTDPIKIIDWWATRYSNALIAMPTGEPSGIAVLDLDMQKPGAKEWLDAHPLDATRCYRTRSGGMHLLYRHVPGLRCSGGILATGVDIRGEGGYVIRWDLHGQPAKEASLAPFPGPILTEVLSKQPAMRDGIKEVSELAPPDAQTVIDLLDRMPNPLWVDRSQYLQVMLAARGCIQGLEAEGKETAGIAEAAVQWAERWEGYDGTDEAAKWESDFGHRETPLAGWENLQRHGAGLIPGYHTELAQTDFSAVPLPATAMPGAEGDFPATQKGAESAAPQASEGDFLPALLPAPEPKRRKLANRFLTADEAEELPDPEWLIDKLVPQEGVVFLYGPAKQGKSFLALSMTLSIAAGQPWFGHAVKQGVVIYLAGEGAGGLKLRLKAARKHYGLPSGLPVLILPRAVMLSNEKAVNDLIAAIEVAAATIPVRAVIVDTLARAAPGTDENSAGEMGILVKHADRIKEALGCAVILVHHTGKDATKGMRGSTALDGAADASLKVTRNREVGDVVTLENVYQKEGEEHAPMLFDLTRVQVSDTRSSLALTLRDAAPAAVAEKAFGEPQNAALMMLRELGAQAPRGQDGRCTVNEALWRRTCNDSRRLCGSANRKSREKAFDRAHNALLKSGYVRAEGDNVWIAADVELPPVVVEAGDLEALQSPGSNNGN